MAQTWICTQCGGLGRPYRPARGSFLIEVVLWLMFIMPGMLYSAWRLSGPKACPYCGTPQGMVQTASPRGQELVRYYGHQL